MVTVDVRTRTADDVRTVDPCAFFDEELPALAAERSHRLVPGARELRPAPLAIEVEGRTWTLAFDGDRATVRPGQDDAGAKVRLAAQAVTDLVNDVVTPMGWFTGGDLDQPAGRLEDLLDWWVLLRALIDDQPVHATGAVTFADPDGAPLDLTRAFTTDDDPAEIGHHLATTGFVHLAGVFDPAEMAAVSADMDAAADRYQRGDGRSWWARTRDGEDRLVRMQHFHEQSDATAALLADDRIQRIGRLTTDGHRLGKAGPNDNLVEALVKPIGVVEGISDVPWHKDCSLGSHSYRCCSLTVGISVTGAGPDSGQLRVVAGSHRALVQPAFVRKALDLPQVDLPTETGDVTIHCSCTLHMSQPPVSRERRVLYTDFRLPEPDGAFDYGEAAIARIREGASTTVSQPPA